MIDRLGEHAGETVELRGWMHNRTGKGKLQFVQLRDGTGFVQVVVKRGQVPDELFDALAECGQESSMILEGEVKPDPRAPGGYEVVASGGRVVHATHDYPITPKEHGADFLLSRRHLWLRSKRQWAVMRIRDAVITAIRNFFDERGFVCIDSPMFTPSACEGTSTLFELDYFGDQKAFLTQSGQLYAEASALAFGKVYCFGPSFRAATGSLVLLTHAVVLIHVGAVVLTAVVSLGRPRAVLVVAGLGLALNVLGNALLVPRFGIEGAAVATVATEALVVLSSIAVLVRTGANPLVHRPLLWLAIPLVYWATRALATVVLP